MFGSIALDVAIGLVLMYLLYSLLATIVGEMLSTWMAIRSRMLRIAIERMLNDAYVDEYGNKKHTGVWATIEKFFLKEYQEDFRRSFAGKFYDHPSIKYLSKGKEKEGVGLFPQTKPSYITPDNFVNTLIQLLRQKGSGNTEIERIKFCLDFNTHHIQPESLKQIKNLLTDAKGDLNIFREKLKDWFNEMMDLTNGWYKRKMQFILFWFGFLLALAFNVDSISIARLLANDKDARKQLVDMGIALSKDSAKYKPFIEKPGDSIHAQTVIDSGYLHVMKDIDKANLVMGLGWNFGGLQKNDSGFIYSYDYNKVKRNIAFTDTLLKYFDATEDSIYLNSLKAAALADSLNIIGHDTTTLQFSLNVNPGDSSLLKRLSFTKEKINLLTNQLNLLYISLNKDAAVLNKIKRLRKIEMDRLNALTAVKLNDLDSIRFDTSKTEKRITVYGKRQYSILEEAGFIFSRINPFTLPFWGWIITGLMLSLGAPFWFDLLKRLVAIRGAGVNPDEKKENVDINGRETKPGQPETQKGENKKAIDSLSELFVKCKRELLSIDGVVLVKDLTKYNQWKLEIYINKEAARTLITQAIQSITGNSLYIEYAMINTDLQPRHFNESDEIVPLKGISNESKMFGFGALGCVVFNTFTKQRNFISCWHVMKGDRKFDDNFSDSSIIIDYNSNTIIGQRSAGGINDELDIGIGVLKSNSIYSDNSFLGLGKLFPGILTPDDADNKLPVVFYDNISGAIASGNIINSGCSVKVFCLDGIFRNFHDIIVISKSATETNTISQAGNSGSIVIHKTNNESQVKAMIIAGDKRFTYAVAMDKILSHFDELQII